MRNCDRRFAVIGIAFSVLTIGCGINSHFVAAQARQTIAHVQTVHETDAARARWETAKTEFPECVYEDGSGGAVPCWWDGATSGLANGGRSYIIWATPDWDDPEGDTALNEWEWCVDTIEENDPERYEAEFDACDRAYEAAYEAQFIITYFPQGGE